MVRLVSLAGAVTASVNAGKIDLDSVTGPIQATDNAGSITGQRMSSVQATMRVSAGEIDVSFSLPPTAVTATSEVGAVTVRVPGNVPYSVIASATVGDVHVGVTRSTTALHRIIASTRTGSVTIEPSS
jgi:hypothetical protein